MALSLPRWQSSDSRATKINSDREGGGGLFANGLSAGTSRSSGCKTCRTAPSAPRSIKTNLYRHSSDNANRSASATAASDCFAFDYKVKMCYLNAACASQDVGDGHLSCKHAPAAAADAHREAQEAATEMQRRRAEAAAKRQATWGGRGGDKLEKIGGRLGMATTQLNISPQQLALMIKAQKVREAQNATVQKLNSVLQN